MNVELTIFTATVFATFFNNALHWYTQVQTYPLFAWIGQREFVPFHQEYQRRLPLSIYAPYLLVMVSTVLLVFFRPPQIALGWIAALLLLNGSVMAISIMYAAPVHYRLDRQGSSDNRGVRQLVYYNGIRLAASTLSSAIVLYLLINILSV